MDGMGPLCRKDGAEGGLGSKAEMAVEEVEIKGRDGG